jgi:hypothetical protein
MKIVVISADKTDFILIELEKGEFVHKAPIVSYLKIFIYRKCPGIQMAHGMESVDKC